MWQTPLGELIIVDYKATSKKEGPSTEDDLYDSYKRQMEIYQWLFRRNGFKVSPVGYFVYANGDSDKVASHQASREAFVEGAPALLAGIQEALFDEAKARLGANIVDGIRDFAALADYFGPAAEDDADKFKGWARVAWSRPTGAALDEVEQRLKALKLTIRNTPLGAPAADLGPCLFTGAPAVEQILVARAY